MKLYTYDTSFIEVPDELTLVLYISECPFRCKGCHSEHLRESIGNELTDDILLNLINRYKGLITNICFMGGDQFPEELLKLLKLIKTKNIKTTLYSGQKHLKNSIILNNLDYLKIGPYIEKLGPLVSKKTNQKMFKIKDGSKVEDITYKFWK